MAIHAENALARYQQETMILTQRAIFAETEVAEQQDVIRQLQDELAALRPDPDAQQEG